MLDSAGQSVDWNTYVLKSQGGLDRGGQLQKNAEASEDAKASMRENQEVEEKNSPASTEDAGSFERSMKELENAWQRARDNVRR